MFLLFIIKKKIIRGGELVYYVLRGHTDPWPFLGKFWSTYRVMDFFLDPGIYRMITSPFPEY